MVDVDRRGGLTPSHLAGLRRLSARASSSSSSTPTPAAATALLADAVLSHFRRRGLDVQPGLSDSEFAVLEAEFAFTFPPDLHSLLASGLPSSPGFPDWRCPSSVHSALRLPVSAVVLLISRHPSLWPRSWGPRPADPDLAIQAARSALKKVPPLIPLFDRCYIPSTPSLSGNPIFYVDEDRVSCCSTDLAEFFNLVGGLSIRSSGSDPDLTLRRQRSAGEKRATGRGHLRRSTDMGGARGRAPRWVKFWTDMAAAIDHMQRNSSSSSSSMSYSSMSSSSPDRCPEAQRRRATPKWVEEYMCGIRTVLREGGWSEAEVTEMVEVSAAGILESGEMVLPDNEALMEALLLKADRCSSTLRKAGWSSEEVSEAFPLDLFRSTPDKGRRPAKELPPEVMERIARLAESVCRP
ncbi:hypothetical protein MLD38_028888 [Melastoma candidum]|uniref:Uncharacterized protein n=1 Tax=Melastoma candidum TaxID=119954 RepID=A0ACB9N373_9MYRT|nr:hypothetical protein MLD38_028888 [Melastoma candidum]